MKIQDFNLEGCMGRYATRDVQWSFRSLDHRARLRLKAVVAMILIEFGDELGINLKRICYVFDCLGDDFKMSWEHLLYDLG